MDFDSLDLTELLGSDAPPPSPSPSPKRQKPRRRPPSSRPRPMPILDDFEDEIAAPTPEPPSDSHILSVENRISEYMNLALDNLRDDFHYELRFILENACVIEPITLQFIHTLTADIRQEISLKADHLPHVIEVVDFALPVPKASARRFDSLSEVISQISAHAAVLSDEFTQSKAELSRALRPREVGNESARSSRAQKRREKVLEFLNELEAVNAGLTVEKARLERRRNDLQRRVDDMELRRSEQANGKEFLMAVRGELADLALQFAEKRRPDGQQRVQAQLEKLICEITEQRLWQQKLIQTVTRMTDLAGAVGQTEAMLYSPLTPLIDESQGLFPRTPSRDITPRRVASPSDGIAATPYRYESFALPMPSSI